MHAHDAAADHDRADDVATGKGTATPGRSALHAELDDDPRWEVIEQHAAKPAPYAGPVTKVGEVGETFKAFVDGPATNKQAKKFIEYFDAHAGQWTKTTETVVVNEQTDATPKANLLVTIRIIRACKKLLPKAGKLQPRFEEILREHRALLAASTAKGGFLGAGAGGGKALIGNTRAKAGGGYNAGTLIINQAAIALNNYKLLVEDDPSLAPTLAHHATQFLADLAVAYQPGRKIWWYGYTPGGNRVRKEDQAHVRDTRTDSRKLGEYLKESTDAPTRDVGDRLVAEARRITEFLPTFDATHPATGKEAGGYYKPDPVTGDKP